MLQQPELVRSAAQFPPATRAHAETRVRLDQESTSFRAVDTELNPSGRANRGSFKANLTPREFVSGVMKGLQNDVFEIGYGMTEGFIQASRAELDKSFEQLNSRM